LLLVQYGSVEKTNDRQRHIGVHSKRPLGHTKYANGKEACIFLAQYMTRFEVTPLQESKTGHVYAKGRSVTSQNLLHAHVPAPCV